MIGIWIQVVAHSVHDCQNKEIILQILKYVIIVIKSISVCARVK